MQVDDTDVAHIPVYRKGRVVARAIVDAEFAYLAQHHWKFTHNGYVCRNKWVAGKSFTLRLHRVVTACPPTMTVDHGDKNKLNNLRSNLECVPLSVNVARGNKGTRRGATKVHVSSWRERVGLHISSPAMA